MSDTESTRLFRAGEFKASADRLEKNYQEQGETHRDALIYLLDIGTARHAAGEFAQSNASFLKAEKVAEIKDYTSLTSEAASLITGENVRDYSGEDYEKILIPVYLAMNYALLGQTDDGLVEARKTNRILRRMRDEGARPYSFNAFAFALSSILYEENRDFSDAWLDYREVEKLLPHSKEVGRILWRIAFADRRHEELAKLVRDYHLTQADQEAEKRVAKGDQGELIVLYENGLAPVKRPHPTWHSLPMLVRRWNPSSHAQIRIREQRGNEPSTARQTQTFQTQSFYDVESTAFQNLDHKFVGIVAKRVGGLVVKTVIAKQLERATNSPLLGFATQIALMLSDQADLRSWQFLPQSLQLSRIALSPGTYELEVEAEGVGKTMIRAIEVRKGHKTFVNLRYLPQVDELIWPTKPPYGSAPLP